jgi:DNA-binding NarL/FixJ family response regulator
MESENSRATQEPSRIIIADDHPLFRSALVRMFDAASDLEVVGEAANGQEAVDQCRRLRPELVLMDLRMPQMDGIAATHAIKREFPDTLVLILTALDESKGLSDSLQAGAAGYILKHAPAAQITHAVRRVLAGESPLNEELAMRLLMSVMDSGTQEEKERDQKGGTTHSSASERPLGERGIASCPLAYASRS